MRILLLLCMGLAAVAAVPRNPLKIVGGSTTTISQYPQMAALLYSWNLSTYFQACGGTILNTRAILTAAHCVIGDRVNNWRIRVGSTFANSGGAVHNTASWAVHADYNRPTLYNNDVAVMRTASVITYINNAVRAGTIAGANYNLPDNSVVWTTGWGRTASGGQSSETLRHVQVWVVNQNTCANRYRELGGTVTNGMVCAGWLDVGGRDACQGDSGGPLFHNGIIVGVTSWGEGCALARYPGVNARVSFYSSWIQANA